jgi:plastocyanin
MQHRPRTARAVVRLSVAAALLAGTLTAAATTTSADSDKVEVRMRDECEPTSFNAALGDGACVGDGDVTFDEVLATLTPSIGGHDKWRNKPTSLKVKVGTTLRIVNQGGEAHSFTEVVEFGGGIVPPLNEALPNHGLPLAEWIGDPHFVDAGEHTNVSGLSAGTHRFQCVIHPWMKTTVNVGGS